MAVETRSRAAKFRVMAARERVLSRSRGDPGSKAFHEEAARSCELWAAELELMAETAERIAAAASRITTGPQADMSDAAPRRASRDEEGT